MMNAQLSEIRPQPSYQRWRIEPTHKKPQQNIPQIIDLLRHGNRAARSATVEMLQKLGEQVRPYVSQIINLLTEKDRYTHFAAIEALISLKDMTRTGIAQLVGLLTHPNWEVRFDAAETLGALGGEAQIPSLMALLEDADARVRSVAVDALEKLCETTTLYFPQIRGRHIARQLDDADPTIRATGARALNHLGEIVGVYIPQIEKRLADPDAAVRSAAIVALGFLSKEAAPQKPIAQMIFERISSCLQDQDPNVRITALETLGEIGEERQVLIPQSLLYRLTACLDDPNPAIRRIVPETLGRLRDTARMRAPLAVKC